MTKRNFDDNINVNIHHISEEEFPMGSEHIVSIQFWIDKQRLNSLEEFMKHYPNICLNAKEISEVKGFLTALCCSVAQEWDAGYILEDENGYRLTLYLKQIIREDKEHRYYFCPIRGMRMFFEGLKILRIYDLECTGRRYKNEN